MDSADALPQVVVAVFGPNAVVTDADSSVDVLLGYPMGALGFPRTDWRVLYA